MHELSLCQAILEHVEAARRRPTGAPRRTCASATSARSSPTRCCSRGRCSREGTELAGCELDDRARAGGRALPRVRRRDDARLAGPGLRHVREPRRRAASAATSSSWPGSTSRRRCADGPLPPPRRRHRARARRPRRTTTTTATSATTAGTPTPGVSRVAVLESILSENDRVADANRRRPRRAAACGRSTSCPRPGAGKTTLLKRTLVALGDERAHRRARGRHRHQPRRRRARRPRRRDLAREHERRLRR